MKVEPFGEAQSRLLALNRGSEYANVNQLSRTVKTNMQRVLIVADYEFRDQTLPGTEAE